MLVLTMAAACCDEIPTIAFDESDDIADLH